MNAAHCCECAKLTEVLATTSPSTLAHDPRLLWLRRYLAVLRASTNPYDTLDRLLHMMVREIGVPLPSPYQSVVPARVMHHVIKRTKVCLR
jgi:hypothetical protein